MAHWTVAILPQCLMGSLWRPSKAPIIIGIGKIILCCDNFINLQWTMTIYNIIMKDEQLHQTTTFSIGKWCDKLNNDQSHLVWDELRLIEISQICYVCNFVLKRSCMVLSETSVPRSIHWFIITFPFKAYAILIPKQIEPYFQDDFRWSFPRNVMQYILWCLRHLGTLGVIIDPPGYPPRASRWCGQRWTSELLHLGTQRHLARHLAGRNICAAGEHPKAEIVIPGICWL